MRKRQGEAYPCLGPGTLGSVEMEGKKLLFISHTNKLPNRVLSMIDHFMTRNEVFLLNCQRDRSMKNNFQGIKYINIYSPGQFLGMILFYIKALRICRVLDFDLGYCSSIRMLPLLAAVARQKGGAVIYDSIEIPTLLGAQKIASRLKAVSEKHIRRFLEAFEGLLLRLANGVLVIDSRDDVLLKRLRKVQPNAECIMNYPSNQVPLNQEEVDRFHEQYRGRKLIVYAGGMFGAKGLYRYFDLTARLKEDDQSILLLMVGMLRFGENRKEIDEYLRKKGLIDHVQFLPWMNYRSLLALLQCARVGLALQDPGFFYFQFASMGNSRKPFTYMLAGVPVVVSLPVIGRFVEEKGVGRYVDFHDGDAIYRAVREILTDDGLHGEMSRRGKQLIQRECNWENELFKAERVFERALKGPAKRQVIPWKKSR